MRAQEKAEAEAESELVGMGGISGPRDYLQEESQTDRISFEGHDYETLTTEYYSNQ